MKIEPGMIVQGIAYGSGLKITGEYCEGNKIKYAGDDIYKLCHSIKPVNQSPHKDMWEVLYNIIMTRAGDNSFSVASEMHRLEKKYMGEG